jgi:hypothetical protein
MAPIKLDAVHCQKPDTKHTDDDLVFVNYTHPSHLLDKERHKVVHSVKNRAHNRNLRQKILRQAGLIVIVNKSLGGLRTDPFRAFPYSDGGMCGSFS